MIMFSFQSAGPDQQATPQPTAYLPSAWAAPYVRRGRHGCGVDHPGGHALQQGSVDTLCWYEGQGCCPQGCTQEGSGLCGGTG